MLSMSTLHPNPKPPTSTDGIIEFAKKRINQGDSTYAIADELNMPQSTLGNMLRKAGIYISKMNKAVPHEN